MIWLKLVPVLISVLPEIIRAGLQVAKDRAAAARLEEERKKAEREGKLDRSKL